MSKLLLKFGLILITLTFYAEVMYGQDTIRVSGTIVGGNGLPLQDVSVSVEGTGGSPAVTDKDGYFEINALTGNEWLLIYPLGNYKSKRIFLNNREKLKIFLTETNMVTGYDDIQVINYIEKRRNITASFKDLNMEIIQKNNIISIDQAFQEHVPGVYSINHSGQPGQGNVSFIRGISTLNATSAPLFIVDGMPIEDPGIFGSNIQGYYYNPVSTIDPFDISRITVYKDPVVSTQYGSMGSNGVVSIETLRPESIETSITASFQSGFSSSKQNFHIPQLNSVQYKSLANEILASSPLKEEYFEESYPGLYMDSSNKNYYRYMHNTNWQNLIYSDAIRSKVYLAVKGGSEIATYGLSVGYLNQEGIFKNSSYDRFNTSFVSNLRVFSWFRMDIKSSLSNSNSSMKDAATSFQTSPIIASLAKSPLLGPYQFNQEGQQLIHLDNVDELGISNPLAIMEKFLGQNKNYRFISSVKGQAKINDYLKFNALVGINLNTMKEFVYMPNLGMDTYLGEGINNVSKATNNYLFSIYNNNYFEYNRTFNSIHNIKSSLGFRIFSNSLEIDSSMAANLPVNDAYTSLQSGQADLRKIGGSNGRWNYTSVYNQWLYMFRDKYILNASYVIDYSTRVGIDANTPVELFNLPLGLFYSIGAGWRVSSEPVFKSLAGLENLLFRVSYGVTGNNDVGIYNSIEHYRSTLFRETSGYIPGAMANRSLTYEKTNHWNIGVDLSLWGERTRLTSDYYMKITDDLLIYEPLASYFGFAYMPTNNGTVINRGFEFSLFQRIIDLKQFTWDISSGITFLSNEISKIKSNGIITPFKGGQFITREGDPLNSFYGYNFIGVFSSQAEADEKNLVNNRNIPFKAGDAIYQDLSGPNGEPDGIIDDYDKVFLGSPIPDYFGSIASSIRYKRWSFHMDVQFVIGNEVFNYTRYLNERMVDLSNQSTNVLNRWQKEGDITDVPRAQWNDPVGNSGFSSRWIEDGSYLRLKNMRIQYSFPDNILFFRSADIYLTATNLLTISSYLGYDPEFSYSSNPMRQGIDYGLIPLHRQFMIGIDFGL